MNPRCEAIGKYVVPLFRSMVAKELINTYNLTQTEAAQRLGTTQAAISQYINSKRASKGLEQFGDDVMPKIQAMANNTAKRLVDKEVTMDDVTVDFCKLCMSFCCKNA